MEHKHSPNVQSTCSFCKLKSGSVRKVVHVGECLAWPRQGTQTWTCLNQISISWGYTSRNCRGRFVDVSDLISLLDFQVHSHHSFFLYHSEETHLEWGRWHRAWKLKVLMIKRVPERKVGNRKMPFTRGFLASIRGFLARDFPGRVTIRATDVSARKGETRKRWKQ